MKKLACDEANDYMIVLIFKMQRKGYVVYD